MMADLSWHTNGTDKFQFVEQMIKHIANIITGCRILGCRRAVKSDVKTMGLTHSLHLKLMVLRVGEVNRIPGVLNLFHNLGTFYSKS